MHALDQERLDCFMQGLKRRNSGQCQFAQAVYEVALDVIPFNRQNPNRVKGDSEQ